MNLLDKYRQRLNDARRGREDMTAFVSGFNDPCFLINQTLQEINQAWEPGALEWMKVNRREGWGNMLTLEERINKMAMDGDTEGLREALSEYKRLILAVVKELKTIKEEKG